MTLSNGLTKRFGFCSLLFILIGCSITQIHANTNSENLQASNAAPAYEATDSHLTNSIEIPQSGSDNPDISANQSPIELQLNILAGMCEHILDALEKGKWNLPHDEAEKKYLNDATLDTFGAAYQLLKSIKDSKPDITTQYLFTFVINHQLELLNNLLLRKPIAELNLEEQLKAAQSKEKTIEELAQLIMKSNAAFETLHSTIQDLDARNMPGELQDVSDSQPKKATSALDRTSDQVLKQLCFVDAILEELALFIDNNSLQVNNRADALAAIKNARAIIESRKYDRGEITQASIYDLLTLNKHLVAHVRTMIRSDFKNLPNLDKTALTTRTKREVTFEELDEKYQANEALLAELRAESEMAGLKNYHILFRKLEPYWTKTLDGGRRIIWPLSSAFLATIAAHQAGILPKWFDVKIPYTNLWFYGDPWKPLIKNGTPIQPDDEREGLISNAYNALPGFVMNPLVLSVGGIAAYYGASDWKQIQKNANDYLAKLYTFLLGRKEVKDRSILTHIEPKYTFKDVVGQQEIKHTLSTIVRYFEDPQGIDNRGLKLEKGYLFTGKTRSGKSFMAEALAGEIRNALKRAGKDDKAFRFIVAPQEILRQSGGFHLCMEHARRYAPCILFIDEIHLLSLQSGQNNALLGEFLTELSGCMSNDPESKVFVIAATNHEDSLDKALRQSGRLGKEIRFEYPTYTDRRTFIVNILEKRTVNVQSDKWARAINQLAREAEDCTYEDIRRVIEDAFVTAKFNSESIEPESLNRSFDKNIRGIVSVHDHEISAQERQITAAHQAGYALASKILAPHLSIAKVTIEPIREGIKERSLWSQWNEKNDEAKNDRIVHGKLFTYGKKTRDMLVTVEEQINACIIASSGYAAGNIQLGVANNSSSYLPEKRQEAVDIARMMITKGIRLEDFNETIKQEFIKRALVLRAGCEAKAAALMEQNKDALNALYNALLKHGTLNGKTVDAILAQHTLKGLELDLNMINFIESAPISA